MSNPDSFIEEVTEEVRRDKLFAFFRRYGWIGVTLVVLIVAGAAYNEWRAAQARAGAEALGDAISAAAAATDAQAQLTALRGVEAEGEAAILPGLLAAGVEAAEDDKSAAIASLKEIADNPAAAAIYRQLATLKMVMLMGSDTPAADRRALLQPLTIAGAPFRTLAEEQLAVLDATEGDTAAAIERLRALLSDSEATAGLRQRASQLIVALGETP